MSSLPSKSSMKTSSSYPVIAEPMVADLVPNEDGHGLVAGLLASSDRRRESRNSLHAAGIIGYVPDLEPLIRKISATTCDDDVNLSSNLSSKLHAQALFNKSFH